MEHSTLEQILQLHIARVQELRIDRDFVDKLHKISKGQITKEETKILRGISSTSSKRFYGVGRFQLGDGPIDLGILVGCAGILEFKTYLTCIALLHDSYGTELQIQTYKFIGLIQSKEKEDIAIVLDDFGIVSETLARHPQIEEVFSDTDSMYFSSPDGHLIAGDFDKALPAERYHRRYYQIYNQVANIIDKFVLD